MCRPSHLSVGHLPLRASERRRRAAPLQAETVFGAVADAVGTGEITPDEGQAVASILEAKRRAIETVDLEARLSALEQERK